MLLFAGKVAQLIERLLHVLITLPWLCHLQVFQHLLHLFEQLLRGLLVARARQALHAIDHSLEILLAHHARITVERTRKLLRILLQLLC